MNTVWSAAFAMALLSAGVRMCVPLIFGSVGEVLAERTGVMNIGLEGEMLIAALAAFMASCFSGSLLLGMAAGALAGTLSALLIAFWCVYRRQDQSVVGIMFNIFAIGFTNFLYRAVFGVSTDKARVDILPTVAVPGLSRIPFLGPILFNQNILAYAAMILALAAFLVMRRLKIGLQMEAAGENARAARAAGVNVRRLRTAGYLISGCLAGIAGGSLSLGIVGTFTENMSAGRGFICLAITILSRWNPLSAVVASLLFGTVQALQLRLQAIGSPLPYQFFVALPYVVTLLSLVIFGRNLHAPSDLGNPYSDDSR